MRSLCLVLRLLGSEWWVGFDLACCIQFFLFCMIFHCSFFEKKKGKGGERGRGGDVSEYRRLIQFGIIY